MRNLFIIFLFSSIYAVQAQKPPKVIFNKKSFPNAKFQLIDSLNTINSIAFYKLLAASKKTPSLTVNNDVMPIFKPNYKSSMSVYGVDKTSSYFLRVYPISKY